MGFLSLTVWGVMWKSLLKGKSKQMVHVVDFCPFNYIISTMLIPDMWSAMLFAWQVLFSFLPSFSPSPTCLRKQSLHILCIESAAHVAFSPTPLFVFLFWREVLGCVQSFWVFVFRWEDNAAGWLPHEERVRLRPSIRRRLKKHSLDKAITTVLQGSSV